MLVDSHCHLDFDVFHQDIELVLEQAKAVGVTQFVIPGVCAKRWQAQLEFCRVNKGCHPAFGIHPYFLKEYQHQEIAILENYIKEPSCIAVGECGIDSKVDGLDRQAEVLLAQVELANQYAKPLILHHRNSHHHIFSAFKRLKPKYGGVVHAFSGSLQDAKKYIELGLKLGCGGTITYQRSAKTQQTFKAIELQHILLETDSPDMPLSGQQGQRNEPKNILTIAQNLAQLKQVPLEEVTSVTTTNTTQLFDLKITL